MSISVVQHPAAPSGPRPSSSPAVVSAPASTAPRMVAQVRTTAIFAAAMMPKRDGIANRPTTVPSMNSRPVLHDITTPTARSIVTLTLVAPRAV